MDEKTWGKTPAVICTDGSWRGLTGWTHGTTRETREECDLAGCNAGLLTGHPLNHQQFLAYDFDLDGANTEFLLQARSLAIAR
jgi:hypothetical protein